MVIAHTDDRSVLIARRPEDVDDRDLSWLDASMAADVSRDGRQLLFTEFGQGAGSESAAYLRGMDGSAAVRLAAGRAGALSPDTRWALCLSAEFPHLELLPTGAGESRRLTTDGFSYFFARWLDGKRIVVSARETGRLTRMYLQELESGQPKPLTPEGVTAWAISPDRSTIAVRGPGPAIRLYPVDGSAPSEVPQLTGVETPVGWIPDGLLIIRPGDPDAPLGEIYRVDLRTGRQESWRNILPRDPAGIMNLNSIRVTPDGRSLAYTWHRALSNLYVADGLA